LQYDLISNVNAEEDCLFENIERNSINFEYGKGHQP
jgi:hypothetical protein